VYRRLLLRAGVLRASNSGGLDFDGNLGPGEDRDADEQGRYVQVAGRRRCDGQPWRGRRET